METQCCQAEMLASESQAAGAPCDFAAGAITVLSHCLSLLFSSLLVFIDAPQVTDRPCCRTSDRSFSCLLAGLTSKLTTVSRLFIISKTMDRQTEAPKERPRGRSLTGQLAIPPPSVCPSGPTVVQTFLLRHQVRGRHDQPLPTLAQVSPIRCGTI